MTIYNFIIILVAVLFNAIGQILLKMGSNIINTSKSTGILDKIISAFNVPIFFGILCYVISVIVWIYALTKVEVSTAYPILSLGYILVAFLAYYMFGEVITNVQILAMCIIVFGVILISMP